MSDLKTHVSVSFGLQVSDFRTLLRVLEWKLRAQTAPPKLGVKLETEDITRWCGNDSGVRPHREGWDCVRNDTQQWVAALREVTEVTEVSRGSGAKGTAPDSGDQDADRVDEANRARGVLIQGQWYLAFFFFFLPYLCCFLPLSSDPVGIHPSKKLIKGLPTNPILIRTKVGNHLM